MQHKHDILICIIAKSFQISNFGYVSCTHMTWHNYYFEMFVLVAKFIMSLSV